LLIALPEREPHGNASVKERIFQSATFAHHETEEEDDEGIV
jgi:hypothetical protein